MTQSEYEQKKRECLEEYVKTYGYVPIIPEKVFNYAFDRAFALGKQEKDAESKFMCLSDVKSKIDKWMDSHTEEEVYDLLKKYGAIEDADTPIAEAEKGGSK